MERIYINNHTFGESSRGVFIVRGENVVFLGELDPDAEDSIEDLVVDKSLEEADLSSSKSSSAAFSAPQSAQQPRVLSRIPFKDAERIFKERAAVEKKRFRERSKKMNLGEEKDNYENHLY